MARLDGGDAKDQKKGKKAPEPLALTDRDRALIRGALDNTPAPGVGAMLMGIDVYAALGLADVEAAPLAGDGGKPRQFELTKKQLEMVRAALKGFVKRGGLTHAAGEATVACLRNLGLSAEDLKKDE